MSYHNWQEFEEESFFDKLKREIDKQQKESDTAYMSKQIEDQTSDEEPDESGSDSDSDWTPHECSSDEDTCSDSEEEY